MPRLDMVFLRYVPEKDHGAVESEKWETQEKYLFLAMLFLKKLVCEFMGL